MSVASVWHPDSPIVRKPGHVDFRSASLSEEAEKVAKKTLLSYLPDARSLTLHQLRLSSVYCVSLCRYTVTVMSSQPYLFSSSLFTSGDELRQTIFDAFCQPHFRRLLVQHLQTVLDSVLR